MADLTTRDGTFATAQGATGVSANRVFVGWNAAALFVNLAPSAATVTAQLEQSIDGGVTWFGPIFAFQMGTGTIVTTSVTASTLFRVDNPSGLYRTNVTANTAGTFSAVYRIGPVYQE